MKVQANQEQDGGASIGYVRALLDYLRARGLDTAALCPAELLTAVASKDARSRVPLAAFQTLFQRALDATRDPDLPLKLAETMKLHHFGLVGYLAMSCATLGEVLNMLARYERLVDGINETRLVEYERHIELHWLPLAQAPQPELMALSLATWVIQARQLTGRPELGAEAEFIFPAPASTAYYRRVFGAPVRFGQPVTRLLVPLKYQALPIAHGDAEAHGLLVAQAETRLRELSGEPEFVRELKSALAAGLASGRIGLKSVAEVLKLSPRTVQYRLEEHGLSFRAVLDDVRRRLAERYLRDPRIALAEVAFLLGYSEQSNFQHAFRRWLGKSPGEYRRRVQSAERLEV